MTRMFGALVCVLALVAAPAAAEEADYYEVLGVSKQTTPEEVKVRFKKLARQNHPDRFNTDTEIEAAKAKMQLINEAKDTLSDPDKRHKYDMMMSKLSAIQAFAELPTVVVIYLACPAYVSFKLSSLIASILCTGMLVSHFPILVACYLFYKYAMWGPIPEEKRDGVMRLSIIPRLVMFLTLAAIATLLMLSCMEYTMWLAIYIALPCAIGYFVDTSICVATKKERKKSNSGSPRTVDVNYWQRPDYLPWFLSLNEVTTCLANTIHAYDNEPVITYEYSRAEGDVPVPRRKYDVDAEEAAKEQKKAAAAQRKKDEFEKLNKARARAVAANTGEE